MLRKIVDFVEDRTGLISLGKAALHEHIPGGPRWAYVFGSGLALTFTIQAVTGILLAFYFSPSTTDAWGSVYAIQHQVTMGWLIRGLHHFGSSAMVVLCVLHMLQVFLFGAYKKPREVNWLTGLMLLGLIMGFSLTGYLLPWDQKGYWATKVATNIAGGLPLIGETIQTLFQGGSDYGNRTLTGFYALHVFVLPVLTVGLIGLHVYLFRRHGVTPPPGLSEAELKSKSGWFWPVQVLMDAVFVLAILALLIALSVWVGAPLDAPADPASEYDARPEWYFLFLFQLLKYFEGPMVLFGTVVLPGLATVFLVLLPFLDRAEDRRLAARKLWAVVFFAGVGAVVLLTVVAAREDGANPEFQEKLAEAARDAEEARRYAANEEWGIDARGAVVLFEGHKVFRQQRCDECHETLEIIEEDKGPSLRGYLSRVWLERFLRNPSHPKHFGVTKLKYDEDEGTGMDAADLEPGQFAPMVEFLASLSGEAYDPPIDRALAAKGATLFEDGDCSGCHTLDGTSGEGPALEGFGGKQWLADMMAQPTGELFYGELGDGMPAFDHLSPSEMNYLIAWLLHLKVETEAEK